MSAAAAAAAAAVAAAVAAVQLLFPLRGRKVTAEDTVSTIPALSPLRFPSSPPLSLSFYLSLSLPQAPVT